MKKKQDNIDEKNIVKKSNKAEQSQIVEKINNSSDDEIEGMITGILASRSVMEVAESRNITDKFTEEHVTKYLESSEKAMEKNFEDRAQNRTFIAVIVIASLLSFLAMIFILKDSAQLLNDIIKVIVGAITGALGGYGYGTSKKKN